MKKRNFIIGASSLIFTGLYPVVSMAENASTYFSLIWRGLDVGFSNIKLKRSGKKITANIEVKISVKVLNLSSKLFICVTKFLYFFGIEFFCIQNYLNIFKR